MKTLTAIARTAARLCDAHDARIYLVEGAMMRLVAPRGSVRTLGAPFPVSRGAVHGRAVLTRRTIHVHDLKAAGRTQYPELVTRQRAAGTRTILAAPLLSNGTAAGVIVIRRTRVNPFTSRQIALLKTFADQAVIAIENVRLFTELQEKNRALTETLERQTATGEVLRAIAHTQTDAQPVFDTIVRSAARLCGANAAGVFLTDGRLLSNPANHGGTAEARAAVRARYPRPVGMDTMPGTAILTRSIVHVPDIEEPSEPAPEHVRQVGRALGFRSAVAVPMLGERGAVGALAVTRPEPGRFSDAAVEQLKTFADQAVIAIENVRLFTELEVRNRDLIETLERQTATSEVLRVISSFQTDVQPVFDAIAAKALDLCRATTGWVYRFDGELVHIAAAHSLRPEAVDVVRQSYPMPPSRGGATARAILSRSIVSIPDVREDPEYRLEALAKAADYVSVLAVPMLLEGKPIGVITVTGADAGAFSQKQTELLQTFADQAVIAVENVRLFHEIADKSRQLEAASRHKSEFLANMSHELRTPLNAVIGFSEVLIQRMFGELNAKQDEYLKDIYASGQHLLSLINDILDLSKIEAGHMELAPAPFHLPSALENAVTLVRERAGRHGIALQLDLDPGLGELVGDERKVKQVLLNLLSNAVKFTPEGGRISLRAARRDGAVEIAVSDTGVGIAPEDQAAIFEEFRQVGSDERKREGTGLGLTLAKKFVELHGGRMWVESAVGRGSAFTFTLPALRTNLAPPTAPRTPSSPPEGGEGDRG